MPQPVSLLQGTLRPLNLSWNVGMSVAKGASWVCRPLAQRPIQSGCWLLVVGWWLVVGGRWSVSGGWWFLQSFLISGFGFAGTRRVFALRGVWGEGGFGGAMSAASLVVCALEELRIIGATKVRSYRIVLSETDV